MYIITKSPSQSNYQDFDKDWYEDHEFDTQDQADAFKQQLVQEGVWVIHWDYPSDSGAIYPS